MLHVVLGLEMLEFAVLLLQELLQSVDLRLADVDLVLGLSDFKLRLLVGLFLGLSNAV